MTKLDLYKLRLGYLEKFIEIKAPREIIYFSCLNLLKTKYRSTYRMVYNILKEKLIFDLSYVYDRLRYIIYRIWLSHEQAIDRIFPE